MPKYGKHPISDHKKPAENLKTAETTMSIELLQKVALLETTRIGLLRYWILDSVTKENVKVL